MSVIRDITRSNRPPREVAELAHISGRRLNACLAKGAALRVLVGDDAEDPIEVPEDALRLLVEILSLMARGEAVNLVPVHAEMTSQAAADFLSVSRPFLVSLLDAGVIPHHKTGAHRRVYLRDLLLYRTRRDAECEAALDALAKQAQELKLGY